MMWLWFLIANQHTYSGFTLRLLLLTGSNFSDFAILFTFRVLILAILDFNHKTH